MKKIIGIIGSSASFTNDEMYQFTKELAKELAQQGYSIVCGGLDGVMKAASQGVKEANNPESTSICIIPQSDKYFANQYCDIVIPTGIGECRNLLIIRTADVLIAIGGGAGTLSEIAFAWQNYKPIIAITKFGGWAKKLAGEQIDARHKKKIIPAKTITETIEKVNEIMEEFI